MMNYFDLSKTSTANLTRRQITRGEDPSDQNLSDYFPSKANALTTNNSGIQYKYTAIVLAAGLLAGPNQMFPPKPQYTLVHELFMHAYGHLWCPVFKKGYEAVADAAFAKPFGIPDGYIAVALYVAMILLLLGPVEKLWIWIPLLTLAALATLANFLGVRDMANLGSFCFYCMVTTALSPVLLWAIWRLR